MGYCQVTFALCERREITLLSDYSLYDPRLWQQLYFDKFAVIAVQSETSNLHDVCNFDGQSMQCSHQD